MEERDFEKEKLSESENEKEVLSVMVAVGRRGLWEGVKGNRSKSRECNEYN